MSPAIPCSFGSITLSTKTACSLRKEAHLATYNVHKKFSRTSCSYARYFCFQPIPFRLLQNHSSHCRSEHVLRLLPRAAVDTNVTTEEQNSAVFSEPGEDSNEASAASSDPGEDSKEASPVSFATNDGAPASPAAATPLQRRNRPPRKSRGPRVKDKDLIPGATFTGIVRSIQPYGAFVDIGAYTNGLVHISNLSDEPVMAVASVVSVGQEVKVRITQVSMEAGRIKIYLTMRENDGQEEKSSNVENKNPRTVSSDQKRQENNQFIIGQVLNGTVTSFNPAGAFISFPDGKEGFLPIQEESLAGSIVGKTSLKIGQEVNVRVLHMHKNQTTFTMKNESSLKTISIESKGHVSSNPFAMAFRQNKEIAAFLDEREKAKQQVQASGSEVARVAEAPPEESQALTVPAEPAVENTSSVSVSMGELISKAPSTVSTESEEKDSLTDSKSVEASAATESDQIDTSVKATKDDSPDTTSTPSGSESALTESAVATEAVEPVISVRSPSDQSGAASSTSSAVAESVTVAGLDVEDTSKTVDEKEDDSVIKSEANAVDAADMIDEATSQTTPIMEADDQSTPPVSVGMAASSDIPEEAKSETSSTMQADNHSIPPEVVVPEDSVTDEPLVATSESAGTNPTVSAEEDKPAGETSTKAVIAPSLVKKLREETGAGMMDCKNALAETGGEIAKAQEFLRKKGLASAEKRAGKVTADGRIGSYIHDSRIGVLIEVNCETDFVSRGDIFKELVQDLAMQVAACPQVQYLVPEDVPEEVVNKEKEIEMQKEDLLSKPEQFRARIVDGRINKRLQELALLEQPYIKNDKLVVKDWVKQAIAAVGENIRVRRFVRFNLGEGLEKRSENFAADVAAQTAQKASPTPPQAPVEQPAEAKEDGNKAPSVAVSAALVKQLRDETGAGMMNCKKALAESGGNLEKAQEYLRKKGIASAARKSSRMTAEGRISSYIHDSRIGALIEVNSETDFVARNERFKELGNDLAMQVVACPQVQFVSVEDIPESVTAKEREIEMQREDLQSKLEHIREKIVDGRISKRLAELALLEQPFIKDDSLLVKDLVSQMVASLGENIKVRRFARFTLGE